MSSVVPKETQWAWQYRIPLGELTGVDGDPGNNKSSVLIDLAARVSTGSDMPDGTPGINGGVLLLLAEDSLEKTTLQRLEAAGADLDRVATIQRQVLLPDDLKLVKRAISQVKARLVIVDPLMAFLALDANGDQRVRRALTPLKRAAERANAAVVLVRHLTKRGGSHALYRGSGSIGIIAATRSALLIGRDPEDPDMRVLVQTKSNLGPIAPSLLFEPVEAANGAVRIEWRGECEYTAEDVLSTRNASETKLEDAEDMLITLLANGPVEVNKIREEATARGISWRTVERAKRLHRIFPRHVGFGSGSGWTWAMCEDGESKDRHASLAVFGEEDDFDLQPTRSPQDS